MRSKICLRLICQVRSFVAEVKTNVDEKEGNKKPV